MQRANYSSPSLIALIPARAGSKRIADKNIRSLAGHPLLAYTVCAALQSEIFAAVVVSTDSERYAEIARHYGAEVPFLRPETLSGDKSPDIEWVAFTLQELARQGRRYDCFSLLRPTSPFRQPETICRAWEAFRAQQGVDSLRAVEHCKQHPGKMWVVEGERMKPLLKQPDNQTPWHSRQYQDLPEVFSQNASLEIAHSRVVFDSRSIAGDAVMPFFTEGYEGFDVNQPADWQLAEMFIQSAVARLPQVDKQPFFGQAVLR